MRGNPSSLLSMLALGMLTLLGAAGCGQLWRPFLEGNAPNQPCDSLSCVETCESPPCTVQSEWDVVPSGVVTDLYAVWSIDDGSEVYTGGANGVLLRSTDQSQFSVEATDLRTVDVIRAITGDPYGPPNGSVYASGERGLLLRKQSDSWSRQSVPMSAINVGIPALALPNPSLMFIGTVIGEVYYGVPGTSLSRDTLTLLGSEYFTAAAAFDNNSVWLVTSNGRAHRTKGIYADSYTVSSELLTLTGVFSQHEAIASAPKTYVVGSAGLVAEWTLGANQFQPIADSLVDDPANEYTAVAGNSSDEVWVIGKGGLCLYYDGKYWLRSETGTTKNLYAIFVTADSKRPWIVGANGLILRRKP